MSFVIIYVQGYEIEYVDILRNTAKFCPKHYFWSEITKYFDVFKV